jgi:hypothetical protein
LEEFIWQQSKQSAALESAMKRLKIDDCLQLSRLANITCRFWIGSSDD